jgi:hypothetical protein
MKGVSLILFVLSIFLFSCEDEGISSKSLEGTYTGTYFPLILPNEMRFGPTEVTLSFHNGSFVQEYKYISAQRKICKGTYKLSGDNVTFKTSCEGNDSVILEGKYNIKLKGSTLEIYRKKGKDDHYELEKL